MRALKDMKREEAKLQRELSVVDSAAAVKIFAAAQDKYTALIQDLEGTKAMSQRTDGSIPYLDSMKAMVSFLSSAGITLTQKAHALEALERVEKLKRHFEQFQKIQDFLNQRNAYLQQQKSRIVSLGSLKKIDKRSFYYVQTLKSYKDALKNPQKMERIAVATLSKLPGFKKFLSRNRLFGAGNETGTVADQSSLAGLQTRAAINALLQTHYTADPNPAGFVQQQLASSHEQSSAQRPPLNFTDAFGNPIAQPGFRPNHQKGKPLSQRLEKGINVQFGNVNRFLPTTADLGVSLGYKLNDKSVIGIGSSYKLGLGRGLGNLHFSQQGITLRSFVDYKLKGSISLTGGYEWLYLPGLAEVSMHALKTWQKSGLIGLSKKYAVGTRFKGTFQLLFDFLSDNSIPQRQPVIFRTGWNF